MRTRFRRLPLLALTPLLAALALAAWVFASPIGAGPDDDFHLVSAWCAGPTAAENCALNDAGDAVSAPKALVESPCFAFEPTRSAACQTDDWTASAAPLVETDRANIGGSYPPVYYTATGAFTGSNLQFSALLMRGFSALLLLGVAVSLFLLLPAHRRPTVVWAFLLTAVPLGLFLVGTNNPSVWAWIGVAAAPIALVGFYETEGRRKLGLGVVFLLSVPMAAGARSDAAIYICIAVGAIAVMEFRHQRRFYLDSLLPLAASALALVLFAGAYFARGGASGFTGESFDDPERGSAVDREEPGAQPLEGFGLLASNLLNVSRLWTGVFGDRWGLGWLDTSMPALVPAAAVAALVLVGGIGFARPSLRRALMVAVVVSTLVVLPIAVLQAGGDAVGEQLQPRYLLPLIALLVVLLTLVPADRPLLLTRVQRFLVIVALSSAQFVALHLNIRRYITGVDQSGPNLDARIEWWWWSGFPSPNAVWLLGSLAFTLLVAILVTALSRPRVSAPSTTDAPLAPVR